MTYTLLIIIALALTLALAATASRRQELARLARAREERRQARERGSHRARLQYPQVDLSRCIGCGTCVQACPEEGVLELVHGQALVVHGARCVGHGRCAVECPTGGITVELADLAERTDLPALTDGFETAGVPGLFLAGEVTGYALIRTAVGHGTAVANEVSRRLGGGSRSRNGTLDLLVVGAGPAGLACSLEARRRGLYFETIEQEHLGGTVSTYPRRKLVMTQPVELPLHGRLRRTSYEKEELVELWDELVHEHELPVRTGVRLERLSRDESGVFQVDTTLGHYAARNVCLALGRRGTPRKLGVPGEDLPKVAYSLLDAQSYRGRRILVVGGGDSAVEAALGLAEQEGNRVTLSYRRKAFTRLKARNESRLETARAAGRLEVLFESNVRSIAPDSVDLSVGSNGTTRSLRLPNDEVFVMAGGIPPFELLRQAGVSFDPADRAAPEKVESGTGFLRALTAALLVTLAALGWAYWWRDYYGLPAPQRVASPWHELLRPSGRFGLAFGIAATALVAANLAYLLRRSPRFPLEWGTLRSWMTVHVATGVLALVLATLHAAMLPGHTVGGHALAGFVVLVATGAIGRWLYAFVPRAANGRELALEEVQDRLAALSAEWDRGQREFGERMRRELSQRIDTWSRRGWLRRLFGAIALRRREERAFLRDLRRAARIEDLPPDQVDEMVALAERAHRAAFAAELYEDLRGLLGSWRWMHRWVALLAVLLIVVHIMSAVRFGKVLG